jgi:hypothetical protein
MAERRTRRPGEFDIDGASRSHAMMLTHHRVTGNCTTTFEAVGKRREGYRNIFTYPF